MEKSFTLIELLVVVAIIAIDDFTQIDRATIAQLTSPISKLVTAITHRKRIHVWVQCIATQNCRK